MGVPTGEVERLIGEARRHQAIIGWDKLLQGFISEKWARARAQQQYVARLAPSDRKRALGWEIRWTKCIIEFGLSLWKYRNEMVHGKSAAEHREKVRKAIEERVRAMYTSSPRFLARFPAIQEVSLIARLRKPTNYLAQWLRRVAQQKDISERERQRDQKRYGSILTYFIRPGTKDPG